MRVPEEDRNGRWIKCHGIHVPGRRHYRIVLPGWCRRPDLEGGTDPFFIYQDHHIVKAFGEQDVDVQQIENVGALISVALAKEDLFALGGAAVTTFRVVVPAMGVTEDSPQNFKTKSITTIQAAIYVERLAFPALQTYKVDHLDGTANVHARPA